MVYAPWKVGIVNEKVAAEIRTLPPDLKAAFLRVVELLEEFGPFELGMPHVKPLENKLWEMRLKGSDGIARGIYVTTTGRQLLVLHVFRKKTQKTPRRAIETAKRRMKGLEL